MVIKIYDREGNEKAEVSPNDNSTLVTEIEGDDVLSLSFRHYGHIVLEVDDYVDYGGERYRLCEQYRPRQTSTVEWEYDLKLYGTGSLLRNILVIKRVDGEDEPEFTLTAPPREHVAMIVNCLNEGMGGIADWKVGQVDGTENIVIDYHGKYCDEALKEIAEKVEAEYWTEGSTVNVCRCEQGEPITLGYDKGLLGISPDRADNVKFYTRLYPVGSTRNIDREKYGHSRLQLPGGAKYVEVNADKYGRVDHYEKEAFAGIYPRRTGTVSSVRSEVVTGDDGEEFTIYYFKDEGLTFDPNDYEIGGLVKRVSFQEGSELAGLGAEDNGTYYFEVNFDSATREFEIITTWPYDDGMQLPGGSLVPKAGDKYILWNLRMPDEYYGMAEAELLAAVNDYNETHGLDVTVFKASTDHVWVEDNAAELYIGRRVRLESTEYFPETGYRDSRIIKITRKVNMPSQMDIEIGDVLSRTSKQKFTDDIAETRSYAHSIAASISMPDIIRTGDKTKPTDNNLFSSLRARVEFMCRTVAEYVRTRWTFLKGISIGTFAAGKSGAQIDADGNAEVGAFTARGDAVVGGDATVAGKVGANDVAATNSIVTPRITTPDYRTGGLTGEGAGIYTDAAGLTHGEFDYIIARRGLSLTELTIEEIRSVGAGFVASKGACEVEKVIEHPGQGYDIYLKDVNKFVADDFVRYARYDYTNGTYRWAWVRVRTSNLQTRNITLFASDFTGDMSAPEPGDILVQMGHATDAARQGFVYITDKGVQCFDGVNSTSLVGKCRGVFGDLTGITDNGKALSGYGVWTDTLYIGTGKTVYATFAELYASVAASDGALAAYRTEVDSRFDVVNGSLTSIQKSVTSLQSGAGRNLLLKTNRGATNWHATTNAIYQPVITSDDSEGVNAVLFNYPNGNISPTWESYDYALRPERIVEGRTYTLSGEIKAGNADDVKLVLYLATTSGLSHLKGWSELPKFKSDVWEKFVVTFTAIASGTKDSNQWVRFAPNIQGELTYISFRNLKLEEGETATDYSAAPEDYVDDEITAVKSTITEVKQSVDSISARVEAVNTDLDGKISSNTTKINQTASAITSEVSARTEGDAALSSQISQTASGISLKLSQLALSNINHAIGTETPFVATSDFGNKENKVKNLYDVTGIATGDIVTLSLLLRFKGLVWGEGAFIEFQLSDIYGYRGFYIKITEQYLATNGITPDADGYYKLRVQGTSAAITTEVSPTDVGKLRIRLDYIDTGATGAVIEISQLKLELGDTVTAWTSRTGDLDEALADTGIDISNRLINATADNFKIRNNRGAVTMEVDEYGNLTSNAVLVRNLDASTAQYTPYLTTINLSNGYIQLYYPLDYDNGNDNLSLQIGWDEESGSVFRFFGKDGTMAWKAGSQASLIDTSLSTETTITPVNMYKCKATTLAKASAEIKTTSSLPATRLYKKVVQTMGTTTTTYYSDAQCLQAADGYYAEAGLPGLMASEEIRPITYDHISQEIAVPGKTTYSRGLFKITAGIRGIGQIVTWTEEDLLVDKIHE